MNSYNGYTPVQRMKAYKWLMNEYALGNRVKPCKCDSCGLIKGIIEPHSENYSEPYGNHIGQYGFCYRCHMMLHCRFKNPKAFTQYTQEIANGKQYAPFFKRSFPLFVEQQLNGWSPQGETTSNQTTNVLANIHANLPQQH